MPSDDVRPPPGGHSNFSFAGGAEMGEVSANKFARGADQNCGNVMTGRSTTRLHAPPGGHSSIVFDDNLPEAVPRNPKKYIPNTDPKTPNPTVMRMNVENPTNYSCEEENAPEGGQSSAVLGETSQEETDPTRWPLGVSPYPAGKSKFRGRGKRGSTTMTAPETPYERNEERPPPGGPQRMVLGTSEQENSPSKPIEETEKPAAGIGSIEARLAPTIRPPPGGHSQISFG